jgi:hypothetical protein
LDTAEYAGLNKFGFEIVVHAIEDAQVGGGRFARSLK